jgi:hypothetical protein
MIKHISNLLKKRDLRKQIKKSSFNLESLEMASTEEWKRLNLKPKYETEKIKIKNLRAKLKELC